MLYAVLDLFLFYLYFILFYLHLSCLHVCLCLMCGAIGGQKRVSGLLELELEMVVSG